MLQTKQALVVLHQIIRVLIMRAAGLGLHKECKTLGGVPTGIAKLTKGYQLPCQYVIHTTGPKVTQGKPLENHVLLAQCYRNTLDLCFKHNITEIAFCCISTGLFGFNKCRAARTAYRTVTQWIAANPSALFKVIFVVFTDEDQHIYQHLLHRT